MPPVVVTVSVPLVVLVSGSRHEAASRLHQPPGQQGALSESVQPVGLPGLGGLPGEIEGILDRGVQHHLEGLLGEGVHAPRFGLPHLVPVDLLHHFPKGEPVLQALRSDRLGQPQVGNLEVGLTGVGKHHGVILVADKGGPEMVDEKGVVAGVRLQDVGRQIVPRTQFLGHDRPQAGKAHGRVGQVPGGRVVGGLGVVVLQGVEGTDDCQLVHVPGGFGQHLRNLNSGHVGGDGPERAVGLRVPHVDLAGPPFQPQQDAGLGLARGRRSAQCLLKPQELAQAHAQQAQGPHSQEVPPPQNRIVTCQTPDVSHGCNLLRFNDYGKTPGNSAIPTTDPPRPGGGRGSCRPWLPVAPVPLPRGSAPALSGKAPR